MDGFGFEEALCDELLVISHDLFAGGKARSVLGRLAARHVLVCCWRCCRCWVRVPVIRFVSGGRGGILAKTQLAPEETVPYLAEQLASGESVA